MQVLLVLIFFGSALAMLLGLIKPGWVKMKTRGKAALVYGLILFASFAAIGTSGHWMPAENQETPPVSLQTAKRKPVEPAQAKSEKEVSTKAKAEFDRPQEVKAEAESESKAKLAAQEMTRAKKQREAVARILRQIKEATRGINEATQSLSHLTTLVGQGGAEARDFRRTAQKGEKAYADAALSISNIMDEIQSENLPSGLRNTIKQSLEFYKAGYVTKSQSMTAIAKWAEDRKNSHLVGLDKAMVEADEFLFMGQLFISYAKRQVGLARRGRAGGYPGINAEMKSMKDGYGWNTASPEAKQAVAQIAVSKIIGRHDTAMVKKLAGQIDNFYDSTDKIILSRPVPETAVTVLTLMTKGK